VARPPHPGPAQLPLSPWRVLDLSGQLGWLCGKILADLGADVIKVEPSGGDPGRAAPPLLEAADGGRPQGLLWLAYNAGKRSVVVDLERPAGRHLLLELAGRADFLVESFPVGHLESLGLGWEVLHRRNPALVVTSITPYGQRAPHAQAPASDLEIMAAGGALWLAGDPDRPPVRVSLPQAAGWTGAYAAMGTLIAHQHRVRTGRGQRVDVSAQAAMLPILVQAPWFWSMLGENPVRSGAFLIGRNVNGARLRNIWPCRDGFVSFALYAGAAGRQSNRELAAWMEEAGRLPEGLRGFDWDAFDPATGPQGVVERVQDAIGPFLASLTKAEFLAGCQRRRILGYPVATAADIAADPQLEHRRVWQEVPDPTLGRTLRYPSGWARFDGLAPRLHRPAPAPGEHQAQVLEECGLTDGPLPRARCATGSFPRLTGEGGAAAEGPADAPLPEGGRGG
jgi:crotonobetainyl-CoA:carnitine CoA-transferase CaiB-like acyl-CoA transferase